MPPEAPNSEKAAQNSIESRLTLLVLEARGLHLLSNRFAMLSVAAGMLPCRGATSATEVRQVLRDLSASWSKLRNSEAHLLQGFDPALAKIMKGAFCRETQHVFDCFDGMARNICAQLLRGKAPDPADLGEVMKFDDSVQFGQSPCQMVSRFRIMPKTSKSGSQ